MLFNYTKKIALFSLGFVLLVSLPAAGQNYLPGPSPSLTNIRQQRPYQAPPRTYQAQAPYQTPHQTPHQTPSQTYQSYQEAMQKASLQAHQTRVYVSPQFQVAQLPGAGGTIPPVVNPLGPTLTPQIPTLNPQPSGQKNTTSNEFQPKPSQPATIRPSNIKPVTPLTAKNPTSSFSLPNKTVIRKLQNASEKMEMIVNTSRIITLDKPIPQAQVNNPKLLTLTPLSPKQIQMSAKKPGVTQVNIWSDDGQIYTIDILVIGDAQDLRAMLQTNFPSSSLKVVPVGQGGEGGGSVFISGYVDQPENVTQVTQIAEQYYPKVINNVTVSGVQQVLLHTKVMEVSRTKLRTLGIDLAQISGNNLIQSSVSGLIGGVTAAEVKFDPLTGWVTPTPPAVLTKGNPTLQVNVVNGDNAFFGVLEALREDQLVKILAEPTLVAVNGQPAFFLVGGEVPVPVPQSLGTISIQFKPYGTQLSFVPLVLGDGRIRMEVKPRVSELDRSTALFLDGYYVYGFRSREVQTTVEMEAGQTLAIAGLINERIEAERRGLPWISDIPVLGAFFRRVTEKNNEIEMLVLVTPELVEAMDPEEVPDGGPGKNSCKPTDFQLYWKGHLETDCSDTGCGRCRNMQNNCMENGYVTNTPSPGRETGIRETQPMRRVPLQSAEMIPQANPTSKRGASAHYSRQNRYTPQNQIREASRAALPGFQGQLGY